jgi:hypothetical protein
MTVPELDHLLVTQLHDALKEVDDRRALQRILAAVSLKDGVTQRTLTERHDISRNQSTVG